jgi:DNA-binding transcriptional regulator LsrR (DeoR family)
MDRKTALKTIERLKWLIEKKATGKPRDLARSLNISERTLYRLVNDAKDLYSIEIVYSHNYNSFIIQSNDKNNDSTGIK